MNNLINNLISNIPYKNGFLQKKLSIGLFLVPWRSDNMDIIEYDYC